MTGLVLLAGVMVRQNEGSNVKLHRRYRKLSKVFKRSANVNLQQKKAVLVKKRAIVGPVCYWSPGCAANPPFNPKEK